MTPVKAPIDRAAAAAHQYWAKLCRRPRLYGTVSMSVLRSAFWSVLV